MYKFFLSPPKATNVCSVFACCSPQASSMQTHYKHLCEPRSGEDSEKTAEDVN